MTDLLTILQQQIEELSAAMCEIPGTLYMKSQSQEEEVDLSRGIPDIMSISKKLTESINALPSIDVNSVQTQEKEIMELWKQRNELEEQMRDALRELLTVQDRLSIVNEAFVVGEKKAKATKR